MGNESRSRTGTVTGATKDRLEAVAYLPGTGGSNPFPSSVESSANFLEPTRMLGAPSRSEQIAFGAPASFPMGVAARESRESR
jgi:hypothetical protein